MSLFQRDPKKLLSKIEWAVEKKAALAQAQQAMQQPLDAQQLAYLQAMQNAHPSWYAQMIGTVAVFPTGPNNFGQGLMPMGGQGLANAYGPAGQMQRQGLGHAKAVKLPEEVCVEALIGWRRWQITMFGDTLLSNNQTAWKPYEKLSADCKLPSCSGVLCTCGIYAYKEREQAENGENAPTDITHVWGQVSLWGRVIEHRLGFRAQFAYPKAFVNTGQIAQRLAVVYGVKVIE